MEVTCIPDDEMKGIRKQFTRLKDHCYLDNTGAALYPESLIRAVSDDFTRNIYMNPHSDIHSQECVDDVRKLILEHFHTDPKEYTVVFTSGATQALKLVVEAFRFNAEKNKGAFVHSCDNHTSVLGLRQLVKDVDVYHIPHEDFIETLKCDGFAEVNVEKSSNVRGESNITKENVEFNSKDNIKEEIGNALFVYPAQNNFNGFKYPIDCMDGIRIGCLNNFVNKDSKRKYKWHILLDAASFVSTNNLDLSTVKPDFVCMSFYKIFGYPTGLGALLVKNDSIPTLSEKKYYGGGTVDTVLNSHTFFARKKDLSEGFEDGTISFLSIMALKHCFNSLNNLIPKPVNIMETISSHTYCLAKEFYQRIKDLKHHNGRKAIVFYMDADFTDIKKQGGIVTFNIIREDGSFVGYNEFESKAVAHKISIRTGCFCNSGSCQRHFELTNKEIKDRYEAGHKCGGETDLIDGVPTGAVRVSFGYYNNSKDIDKIIDMITECYVPNMHRKIPKVEQHTHRLSKHIKLQKKYTDTLKEIIIYPIEHCAPYTIKSNWRLIKGGLEYNKTWRIITTDATSLDESTKRQLAKIRPEIDLNYNNMILSYPGMNSLCIPLEEYIVYNSICVDEETIEHDCGDRIATWLTNFAQTDLRLVKVIRTETRNRIEALTKMIIMTNANIDPVFDVNSIKGNVIVDINPESFIGDWERVLIGNHEFKVEGCYSQSLKINLGIGEIVSQKTHSKAVVLAVYLSYVRTLTGNKTIEVNSRVRLLGTDVIRKDDVEKDVYYKESKSLKNKINYLLNRRKKFEITAL